MERRGRPPARTGSRQAELHGLRGKRRGGGGMAKDVPGKRRLDLSKTPPQGKKKKARLAFQPGRRKGGGF